MKKFLLFSLASLFLVCTALAQERTVSGKVTSVEDGSALPGVNVVLKGSTTGTVTDVDGNFSLTAPSQGGILVFSFIGLASEEVQIGSRSVIDVQMSADIRQLSEVVVTAVGIEREKKALGYAVSDVAGDKLAQKSEPNLIRSLQGKVAGVNIIGAGGAVGEGSNITIRGSSSLLGNNQPLFVVDGIPFDNTTYAGGSFTARTTASDRTFDLDPNNIESMTVLKGAAAAALYGSRGSNGVIVITTKAGRKGTRKGLEIQVNSSYNIEEVANLPDYQTRYTQGNNFKYVDGNFGTWGAPFDLTEGDGRFWAPTSTNGQQILSIDPVTGRPYVAHPYDRFNDPKDSPFFPELVGDSVLLRSFNQPEQFFERGHVFEYGVSVSGGSDKANFTGGLSRTTNHGITPFNKGERTSINIGGNVHLDNGFYIGGTLNYVRNELTSPPSAGLGTGGTSVTERILYTPPNVPIGDLPIEDSRGDNAWYRPDNDNPFYLAQRAPRTADVDRYYGNMTFGYDIFDWLNVTYRAGFNGLQQTNIEFDPISTNVNPNGRILHDYINRLELEGQFLVTVTRDINEDFNVRAIVGHNVNSRRRERQSVVGTGLIVRGINNLDNLSNLIPNGPNGNQINELRYQAVLADVSFSFRDWAFLNLTGRNDWVSSLPQNERSYLYGGASASVILTDALNIQSNFLNALKVRAGWARVGSDVEAYQTQLINFITNNPLGNNIARFEFPIGGTGNAQRISNTLGNPQLTPEFTTETEAGIDATLWNNRISIDATYYFRSTTDQIIGVTVPSSSGFGSTVSNIGEVTNEGVELGLDITPVQIGDFRWNVYTVFTHNRNRVKELLPGVTEIFVNGFGNGVQVTHIEGEEFGIVQGEVAARHTDGQLLIDPSTAKLILAPEFEPIANPNPDFLLSATTNFSWKGITLSALFDWRKGGEMYSDTFNQVFGRGLVTQTIPDNPRGRDVSIIIPGILGDPNTQQAILDEDDNVIPNGTQLTTNDWWFINTFGSAGSDEFSVFDASTIRLREVSLSYDFPRSLLEKTPFGSASVTLTGRNLWFLAYNFPKSLNFDPETNSLGAGNVDGLSAFQSGNAQGVDLGIIPTTRRYGVNVRFTF